MEIFKPYPGPINSGTLVHIHKLKGVKARVARIPILEEDDESEISDLEIMKPFLGNFLLSPEVVKIEHQGKLRNVISTRHVQDAVELRTLPIKVVRHTELDPKMVAEFVDGCRGLRGKRGVVPDLAGKGNLIVINGKPILVDFNDPLKRAPIRTKKNTRRTIAIPVSRQGYPIFDRSLEVIAEMERSILGRNVSNDAFYSICRDTQRRGFANQLCREYVATTRFFRIPT